MKVEILSRKLIPPSSPTPPHLRILKLSSFDQLLTTPAYATCAFYYPPVFRANEEQVLVTNNSERSEQLQKSLSKILSIYYPLGGRYIESSFTIDCNDKGAEYIEARGSGSLSQLLDGGELETESRNQLLPYILQPPNGPLVAVQFSMFECGGLVVGVSVSHRLADGYSALTFIDDWAIVSRVGTTDTVRPPCFELGSICPTRDLSSFYTLVQPNVEDGKIVSKCFVFSGSAVSKLRAIGNGTRVEVVAALILKALVRVSQARNGRLRPFALTFAYNMRGRTSAIPENCFGNLVRVAVNQELIPDLDGESNVQLNDFVAKVHSTIKKGFTDCAKASNVEDLFLMTTDAVREHVEIDNRSDMDAFRFNSWCRFPLCKTDFGWGEPVWITPMYAPMEINFLVDTKDGKGIEAWVFLEENKMLLFQQDLDIIAFSGPEQAIRSN